MKKILLLTSLIILIPFIIVNVFIRNDEIKFIYTSNMNVRVKMTETNEIIEIPFEKYIIGVVAGEMPPSFENEALKAQAVASRSYVMKQMVYNKDKEYDVVDTIDNQVFKDDEYLKGIWKDDYVENINRVKKAILETYNEYLEYNGEVVEALFFSTSVGATENSEEVFSSSLPYLRSVSSTWDEISPVYEVKYNFLLNDFYDKLNMSYSDELDSEVLESTSTGRVKKIKINDNNFTAGEIVEALNLKSNYFTINLNDGIVNITSKGYGHGVGMSQYGAQAMALNGCTYEKILSYYYQGTTIKKI